MAQGRGRGDAGESSGLHERVIFRWHFRARVLQPPPPASVKSYVPLFVTIGTQAPPLT
jgi:hypothetical protein